MAPSRWLIRASFASFFVHAIGCSEGTVSDGTRDGGSRDATVTEDAPAPRDADPGDASFDARIPVDPVLEAAVSLAGGNPAPSAPSVDFGDVYVGQTRAIPVLITNRSGDAHAIASTSVVATTGVTIERFVAATLESCTSTPCASSSVTWLRVVWTPEAEGAISGFAYVHGEDGTALLEIPISGRAIPLGDVADVTDAAFAGGARCDDGATDSTEAFRAAAATGRLLYVPAAPCAGGRHYRVSGPIAITGPGVVGEPGADKPWIRMYGADGGFDGTPSAHVMFDVAANDPATPVLFTGLHLDGAWDGVTFPSGEWDHLIELRGAHHVTIENNLLENPWGDCIYVGGAPEEESVDVTIMNNTCRNPWRCTVAFIDVDNARVLDNALLKPNGGPRGEVWYHFNLDFEPNPNPAESDWNVEVAFNEFESHVPPSRYMFDVGIAVIMSHASYGLPPDGLAGGNLAVHDNHGSAGTFLQPSGYANGTDFWENVSVYRNFNPNGCWPPLGDCP